MIGSNAVDISSDTSPTLDTDSKLTCFCIWRHYARAIPVRWMPIWINPLLRRIQCSICKEAQITDIHTDMQISPLTVQADWRAVSGSLLCHMHSEGTKQRACLHLKATLLHIFTQKAIRDWCGDSVCLHLELPFCVKNQSVNQVSSSDCCISKD